MIEVTYEQRWRQTTERLRLVREALDLTQEQAAAPTGREPAAWSEWERMYRRIDMVTLSFFCDRHGVPLDYIVRGDEAMMPNHLLKKIETIASQESPPKRRGRPRSR